MAPGLSVDRNRPACCSAVENFVQKRHGDAHKRKLSRARSLINNGWSVREEQKLLASRRNVKNDQQVDDRFANIEKENLRLLIRMQEIGHRQGKPFREQPSAEGCGAAAAAARIVLGAPQPVGPTKCISRSSSLPAKGRGSNSDARMRELRRIDTENQRMLKRLQGAKATVSNNKFEEQHQAQQRVMRMRQEHCPKLAPSRVPLPFSAQPVLDEVDHENERIQDLHAELQRRVEELERMDRVPEPHDDDVPAATPPSARSAASGAAPENAASAEAADGEEVVARKEATEKREYVGGQLPEHSKALVDKLMQELDELEHPPLRQQEPVGTMEPEEEANDAGDAVANLLAAADALDNQEIGPRMAAPDYLSYENVVQRSREALQAAHGRGLR